MGAPESHLALSGFCRTECKLFSSAGAEWGPLSSLSEDVEVHWSVHPELSYLFFTLPSWWLIHPPAECLQVPCCTVADFGRMYDIFRTTPGWCWCLSISCWMLACPWARGDNEIRIRNVALHEYVDLCGFFHDLSIHLLCGFLLSVLRKYISSQQISGLRRDRWGQGRALCKGGTLQKHLSSWKGLEKPGHMMPARQFILWAIPPPIAGGCPSLVTLPLSPLPIWGWWHAIVWGKQLCWKAFLNPISLFISLQSLPGPLR